MDESPFDIESLLQHTSWLSALVCGMLGDPSAVDDVLQETWLRAISHPPTEDDHRSVRAWLGRVARRIALRRIESERARSHRERVVARSEAQVDSEELKERAELQRELAGYVLELAEPYRTAILLRYERGLAPNEIARRLRISQVAARKRVSRGLAELRRRFGQDRDHRAWWVAVAPLLPAGQGSGAGAAILVPAFTVAIAALACLLFVHGRRDRGVSLIRAPASVRADRPHAGESRPDSGVGRVAPENGRDPVGITSDDSPGSELLGRVVGPEGEPVAGARIDVRAADAAPHSVASRARDTPPIGSAISNGRGEFRVAVDARGTWDLWVHTEALAPEIVPARSSGDEVLIQLAEPARVAGTVTRRDDGAPVVGARLRAVRLFDEGTHREIGRATTDERGRYVLDRLPPSRFSLEVLGNDESELVTVIEVEAGESLERDFALEPARAVRGRVVEAGNRPVTGARVWSGPAVVQPAALVERLPGALGESWRHRSPVLTGADGQFELTASGDLVPSAVYVEADGYGRRSVLLPDSTVEESELLIALLPAHEVAGRIVTSRGDPVSGAVVAVTACQHRDGLLQADHGEVVTGADGRFAISELRPDLHAVLHVHAPGLADHVRDLPPLSVSTLLAVGDVVLCAPASVSGSVAAEDGVPVGGRIVTLTPDPRGQEMSPFAVAVAERSARTDATGRFAFVGLSPGRYRLRPRCTAASVAVEVAAGEAREVAVRVEPSQGIDGVVVDVDGVPLQSAAVLLESEPPLPLQRQVQVTRANGRFSFPALTPGSWTLRAVPNSIHLEGGDRMVHAVCRTGIPAGTRDLRVVLPPAQVTTGAIRLADGRPAAGVMVFARVAGSGGADPRELLTYENASSDGTFLLRLPPGARVDLAVGEPTGPTLVGGVEAGSRGLAVTLSND